MVNYYQSSFGIISVIVGDEVFNDILQLPQGLIVDNNGVTTAGQQVLSVVPSNNLIGQICMLETDINDYDPTVYLRLTEYFPKITIKPMPGTGPDATTIYEPFSGYSDRGIRITYRKTVYADHDFRCTSRFYYNSATVGVGNSCTPVGIFSVSSIGGQHPDYIKLGFACCNTAMTNWRFLEFHSEIGSNSNRELYFYRYDLTTSDNENLNYIFNGMPTVSIPYEGIPSSETGGGDGTFDFFQSDDIDFPSLPTLSAVSTGFVSLWSPTQEQMLRLSSFMWNADIFTVDFWKKLIANPMDLIYGLNLVPLNLSSLGYIDGAGTVVVGLIDTGISMDHLSSQWVLFDCGTVNINETWGAYLDYDPYTKLEIYLPFCGVHPLKVDDFIPGTISLKYYIDLLSGTCIAIVKSTKSNKHNDVLNSVVYQFMGNCAAQIPVTAQQFADAVRSAINIAASIGSMVAFGVGGAAVASAAKNVGNAVSSIARTASQEISTGASAVENVMNLKPAIERSGAIGSSGALLAVRTPYLILTRPRMARPDNQNKYTGYPSFVTETLGDLTGWTIVQAIHLDDIPCTSEELNEIDALLKGGVIF